MQDNCPHTNFHWVEDARCYECTACLRPIPPASNLCGTCWEPVDSHKLTTSGALSLLSDAARRRHVLS